MNCWQSNIYLIKFSCRIWSLNPANARCSLNQEEVKKKHFLSHALENSIIGLSGAMWTILWAIVMRVLWASSWTVEFFWSFGLSQMKQANQRWKMEKCHNDQVFSFIAQVPEIFLKQLCICKSQHLSHFVVLFSVAFISSCPSCTLSPCVFFKLLHVLY